MAAALFGIACGDVPGAVGTNPPVAPFDYQLGGPYTPAPEVRTVVRDRTDEPADDLYSVCYVNGFQAQPGEEDDWLALDPGLLLRDADGELVVDEAWDEVLLDVADPEHRRAVVARVAEWIQGCADDGFDAVEIDNLDAYQRSGGLVGEDDAVDAMAGMVAAAHEAGLPVAQKNAAELLDRREELGTDFAIVEECTANRECRDFTDAYDTVLAVEYDRASFDLACRENALAAVVLRDVAQAPAGSPGHVFASC